MPGVVRTHTLFGVQIATANVLGGIVSQRLPTDAAVRSEGSSGEVYARHQSLVGQRVTASFATRLIAQALGLCGVSGTSIASLTGGLTLWAQKTAAGGTRAGVTSHRKYNMTAGLLYPDSLTVEHQGDAVLGYNAIAAWDGTNDPVAITDSQSLPAGIADDERWSLGPITLGSVVISQVRSLSLNFGIDAVSEGSDGEIWDRYVYIRRIQPIITIRGIDIEWFKAANIPLTGLNATHATTSIFLRKRADGGSFVADATADHIKFTAAGLVTISPALDVGADVGPAEVNLALAGVYDGTNAPLTFTDNVAIT